MNKPSGFTLNELLVVVIIVALLATFAAETYVRTYEKSKLLNAVAIIRMIRAAERVYYMDWNNYRTLTAPCTSALITGGYVQCPNQGSALDRAFDYRVGTTTPNTFTATATRLGGRYNGNTVTLRQEAAGAIFWGSSGSDYGQWRPQ